MEPGIPTGEDHRLLSGERILITGAARRIGKKLALRAAQLGAVVILHYHQSVDEVRQTQAEIEALDGVAHLWQADLSQPDMLDRELARFNSWGTVTQLVNNASLFEPLTFASADLAAWNRHLNVNLTAPFLLAKAFADQLPPERTGRIINLLDWRALRPGADHFPYTVSKAALAALTCSLAQALAPRIIVNGLALGAILPPSGANETPPGLLAQVPAQRWAAEGEVEDAFQFLAAGPAYITGEIIHLDGGRHLV